MSHNFIFEVGTRKKKRLYVPVLVEGNFIAK